MPQVYDPPKARKPETINKRITSFSDTLFRTMPMTTAYFTADSALPDDKVEKAGPALTALQTWVNERESFALQPGTLGYARQYALQIDDPDIRQDSLAFLDKLQAMPVEHQKVILAYLRGEQLDPNAAVPATDIYGGFSTNTQVVAEAGLGFGEDGGLNYGAEDPQFASKVVALRTMFPDADLSAEYDEDIDTLLTKVSDGTADYLMRADSVKNATTFLDEEVAGKGFSALTPRNFFRTVGFATSVPSEVGFGAAGDIGRAAGYGEQVEGFRQRWQGVEEDMARNLQPIMSYGLDENDPEYQEKVEERMGAFALVTPFMGAAGAAVLGKAGRRFKFTRSIAGDVDAVRAAQASTRTVRRTGVLGTAAEVYRAPFRKVAERFDEAILRFRRDPESFFAQGINGRQGRKLMGTLAAAKDAFPDDLDGQVGFVREVYGTNVHAGLTRKMLSAASPEEAKAIFIQTVTSPGGSALLAKSNSRLGQINPRIAALEKDLDGIDHTARQPRVREIEDQLYFLDNPERAEQRGVDFLDFNRRRNAAPDDEAAQVGYFDEPTDSLPAIREEIEVQKLRAEYERLTGRPYSRVERVPEDGTVMDMSLDEVDRLADPELWDPESSQGYDIPGMEDVVPGDSRLDLNEDYAPQVHQLQNLNNDEATNATIKHQLAGTFIASSDTNYAYHWTPVDNFQNVGFEGLIPSVPADADIAGGFPSAVYFGGTGKDAWNLLPPARARNSIVLRVKRSIPAFENSPSGYVDEFTIDRPINPTDIEFLGQDGVWHPMLVEKGRSRAAQAIEAGELSPKEAIERFADKSTRVDNLDDNSTVAVIGSQEDPDWWDYSPDARTQRLEELRQDSIEIEPGVYEYHGQYSDYYYTSPDGNEITAYLAHPAGRNEYNLGRIFLTSRRGSNDGLKLLNALMERYKPTPTELYNILKANTLSRKGALATHRALKKALKKVKKIGKLTPEEYNFLKADIQANGIHTPLEIDVDPRTGKAIMSEGFHRWKVAKDLGMDHVPVKITYADNIDGVDFAPRTELPQVDPAMRESVMNELARLRVERSQLQWELDTTFDDNPMFRYPERKFVRAVVRQPVTKLERRVHALTVKHNRILDPAKFVDDLPSRPQLFIHGLDGNPVDYMDQNTTVLSNYMRRAGVAPEVIQRRIGELAEVADQDAFFELIERKIFGPNGDIDHALPRNTPLEVRDSIINLHNRSMEERTHSRLTERVDTRMGQSVKDEPVLGKRVHGGEVTPLPSDPTEFLQHVALPDVDLLIEATSSIRRMVRFAEQSSGPGNVAAKAAWSVPRFAQSISTAVLKPLVMLVRLPAMGMRIQLEQALRMQSFGFKPFKGLPDGLSLAPGGIPVPFTNIRLLSGAFGENGWRLLDPDPRAPGFSLAADNADLGLFLDEVGETKPMTYRWESTAEFRSGRRQPKKQHYEGVRFQIDRARKSWLDRAIAQKGLNREAVLRFLQNDPVAKAFMENRMNKQLRASTYFGTPEGLDGKVITMPASEAANYVEFPERLRGAGRTPEQNADIAESIGRTGYDPNYIGPSGQREGNIIMEFNPTTGTAVIREKHHRIGAAADQGQDLPVEIRVVDNTESVRGIDVDETPDDEFLAMLSELSPQGTSVGKPIDTQRLLGAEWSGSDTDMLARATEQWVDAKIERIRQITNGDQDFIDAIAGGKLGKRGTKTLDPDGRPYAMDYNVAKKDVLEIGNEIKTRIREGVLVNGTDSERAMVAVLQRQQRDALARVRALEAAHPDLDIPSIDIADKRKFRSEIEARWQRGEWEFPEQIEVAKRTGPEHDLGLMGDIEHYANAVSGIMYRGFKPLTYVDKHGTRGSLYTQQYKRILGEAEARGFSGDVAKGIAHADASRLTRDLMYDLNARTSMQRALKDIFWFAPATQEVLYTWLVRIPSNSYWPIGAAALVGKFGIAIGLMEQLGIIQEDSKGEKIIKVPGLDKLVDLIPGVESPDIAFGKLEGLNLVTTGGGVPGLSIQSNFVLGAAAKKWGGPFKALSDVFQPYGPEASVLPMPITYLHEAVFGEAPPWEFLSPDYQKAQWDRTFDSGIQYAYADLSEQGILPPKPEDFGVYDKESGTWDLDPEDEERYKQASDAYFHQLFDLGRDYAQGQAWVRLMGSTVTPMSLYTTSEEKEAWTKFWQDVVVPEGFSDGLSQSQTDLISGYLEDHPNSIGFATFTTLSGEKTKELPFDESLDDAWYDAYYTGERRTATPEEFSRKVMASESRRHYQAQLEKAQREISPTLDPWELLTSGNERNRALAIYTENWNRYRQLNPLVDAQLIEQSYLYATNNEETVRSFEAERLGDTLSLLKQIAPMMTGEEGIRPAALREVQGQIAALYSDEGTFGEPRGETAKAMAWWYENVMSPYIDQTSVLYDQAEELQNNGLDASHIYDQIRALSNEAPPQYKGQTVPSPEEVFYGNRTPEEQEAARNGWASRPVTWLSDFQRETIGYTMMPSTEQFLNQMAEYDNQFWNYINENEVPPSSLEYERLQDMREQTLQAEAAKIGPEAEKYLALNEAAPYVRMTETGFGSDVPTWGNSTGGAQYVIDQLKAQDLSPKGFSEEAVNLKSWFYTNLENARAQDPEFDEFMEQLKYSFPLPGGGWRDGVVLYEAVYFGNFNEQYIPQSLATLGLGA